MSKKINLQNIDSEPDLSGIAVCGKRNFHRKVGTYRLVWIATNELIFESLNIPNASDFALEYFGLIHAYKYCCNRNLSVSIYSNSENAVKWALHGRDFAKYNHHKELTDKLHKAQNWLIQHPNLMDIKLWNRHSWGKNPADVRKLKKYPALY